MDSDASPRGGIVRRGDTVHYAAVGGGDGVREGVLFDGEVGLRRLVLGPGADQPTRAAPAELVVYVVDGAPTVAVEGTDHDLVAGDAVRVPDEATYRLTNPTTESATLLVATGG